MFCVYCGNHMHDHHRFCSKCGKPRDSVVPPQAPPAMKPEPPREDGRIQAVNLASKALEGVAAMLEQGGCADVRSRSSNSKRTVTLTGSSSFDAKFSTRFEHWPENWSKCATYEDPTFMDYLKKFVRAFLAADWTRPEESLLENLSLSRAATSCSRKDEASGTGFVQFDVAITPEGSGGRYTGRISFEEKAFLEHLRVLEEKQEQAAREEVERREAIRKEATSVDERIDAIGPVALYSKAAIDIAKTSYESLRREAQAAVTKLHVLEEAEAKFAELEAKAEAEEAALRAAEEAALQAKAEEERQAAARAEAERIARKMAAQREAAAVDAKIGDIGTVTLDGSDTVNVARAAYDALTEEAQAAVTKLHVLEEAEAKLAKLEAKAEAEEAALRAKAEEEAALRAAKQAKLAEARKVEADRAHQRDGSLERFEIPDGATRIGDFAFRDCRKLREVVIPNSVRVIGRGVFFGCCNLEKVSFSDRLSEIRERAFFGCSSLTEISLPDSLKRIGAGAFLGCTSLRSVDGLPTAAEVTDDAFNGCPLPSKLNAHPTSAKPSPHKRVNEGRRDLDEADR